MSSEVSICNQGISWVGGNRITAFDNGTTEANLCIDNYEELKKAVLESADWSFAMGKSVPAPEAVGPAFGFTYSFVLPPTVLRVISVSDNPDYENNIDWQKEGNTVECDSKIIYVKFIQNIDDTTKFSPTFRQCLSARIAAEFAIPLAKSRQLQKDMWGLYEAKKSEATNNDGLQGRSKKIKSSWLGNARQK